MKSHLVCLFACIGAAMAVPAFSNIGGPTVERVEIEAPRVLPTLVTPDTAYEMSNGRTLVLRSFGNILEMRYAGHRARLLKHEGQGRFASADGRFALLFDVDAQGQARLRQMTLPSERP